MNNPAESDHDILKRYLTAGLLTGGGVATLAAILRTHKLNKKLKESEDPEPKRDEDTVVVSLPARKTASLNKSAINKTYEITALVGAGLLSYQAATALYQKLEDNRMKKLEEEARQRAVESILNSGSIKRATEEEGWITNLLAGKNIATVLAFLGSAAWMKRHLDNKNVDSSKLHPIKPYKIRFERTDQENPDDTDD